MKKEEFKKLVEMAKKSLIEEKNENLVIYYYLKISGYSDEDIDLIVGKAVKDLTGEPPTLNVLVCLLATSLLEDKIKTGEENFLKTDINLAWKAAKLLFYEKAKNSTEAIILSKREKE